MLNKNVLIRLAFSYDPYHKAMQSSLYTANCTTEYFGAIAHRYKSWHHKECNSLHLCHFITSTAWIAVMYQFSTIWSPKWCDTCSRYLFMINSNVDWWSASARCSSLFSFSKSLICWFSSWLPRIKVLRGLCFATSFNFVTSSRY